MRAILIACCAVLAVASCSIIHSTRIENSVLKALQADKRTAGYKFDVSLQKEGEVLITGDVDTPDQVDAVTEIALGVKGVDKVINRVQMPEPASGLLQDETIDTPFL